MMEIGCTVFACVHEVEDLGLSLESHKLSVLVHACNHQTTIKHDR